MASSSSHPADLKMTILPTKELERLRDELTEAQNNNQTLRSHNLQVIEDSDKLQQDLVKERQVVALLDETTKEFVRQEIALKAEIELKAAHIVDLVGQVAHYHNGNAPLYNRIQQLEGLNDALNSRIAGLSNEAEELKKELDRKKSVYPPL